MWKGKVLTRATQLRTSPTSLLGQSSNCMRLGQTAGALPAHRSESPLLTAAKGKIFPMPKKPEVRSSQWQAE